MLTIDKKKKIMNTVFWSTSC